MRTTFVLLLPVGVLLAGCGRKLTYADDLDVAALKSTFACASSPSGDRAQACRILDDFASAGPFTDAPAKSLETWFGRKVCTDTLDAPDAMVFGQVHLSPGKGAPSWPADVKTDPSRDLPFGAQFIGTSISRISPPSLKPEYEKTIQAAEKGTQPSFANLDDFDRRTLERFWHDVQRPPGTTGFQALVRSRGTSVLGAPYTSEATTKPSASYFLRGKGDRMLVVYPSPSSPCVAELWKIHSE